MRLLYRVGPGELWPSHQYVQPAPPLPPALSWLSTAGGAGGAGAAADGDDCTMAAPSLCSVSSRNTVAFAVHAGRRHGLNVPHTGHHVLVADLNTPWHVHVLASAPSPAAVTATAANSGAAAASASSSAAQAAASSACCSAPVCGASAGGTVAALRWHPAGWRLLVGWSNGCCQLWHSPDRLLNVWSLSGSWAAASATSTASATATAGATGVWDAWRHLPLKAADTHASVLDMLFFNSGGDASSTGVRPSSRPTAAQWGGQAADGWLALCAGGQLLSCWLDARGHQLAVAQCNLLASRWTGVAGGVSCDTSSDSGGGVGGGGGGGGCQSDGTVLVCGSLAHHTASGAVLAAVSNGLAEWPVRCWRLHVRCSIGATPTLTLQPQQLASVCLQQLQLQQQLVCHLLLSSSSCWLGAGASNGGGSGAAAASADMSDQPCLLVATTATGCSATAAAAAAAGDYSTCLSVWQLRPTLCAPITVFGTGEHQQQQQQQQLPQVKLPLWQLLASRRLERHVSCVYLVSPSGGDTATAGQPTPPSDNSETTNTTCTGGADSGALLLVGCDDGHLMCLCAATLNNASTSAGNGSNNNSSSAVGGCGVAAAAECGDSGVLVGALTDCPQLDDSGVEEEPPIKLFKRRLRRRHDRYTAGGGQNRGGGSGLLIEQPVAASLCAVAVSACECLAVVLDASCRLHVLQLPSGWQSPATAPAPAAGGADWRQKALLSQLQCCVFSGRDVWDVLLVAAAATTSADTGGAAVFSEACVDAWLELVQQQPAAAQQLYWRQWLTVQAWLCRMAIVAASLPHSVSPSSPPAAGGAAVAAAAAGGVAVLWRRLQLTNAELLMRTAVSVLRRLLLAQDDVVSQLLLGGAAAAGGKPSQLDTVAELDKVVLLARDRDSVTLTPEPAALAHMAELCQWSLDLCLTVFAPAACHQQQQLQLPLLRHRRLLLTARELLVLVRRCGQLRATCVPRAPRLSYAGVAQPLPPALPAATPNSSAGGGAAAAASAGAAGGGGGGDATDTLTLLFRLVTRLLSATPADLETTLATTDGASLLLSPIDQLPLQLPPIGTLLDCAALSLTTAKTTAAGPAAAAASAAPGRIYMFYESKPVNGSAHRISWPPHLQPHHQRQQLQCRLEVGRHRRLAHSLTQLRRCSRCAGSSASAGGGGGSLAPGAGAVFGPGAMSSGAALLAFWHHLCDAACLCGGSWRAVCNTAI